MRICKNCIGQEMTMSVSLFMVMPSSLEHKITKRDLRKKKVEIWGADWDNARFTCPKCGYIIKSLIERRTHASK